jgi:PEP-CTERM motif
MAAPDTALEAKIPMRTMFRSTPKKTVKSAARCALVSMLAVPTFGAHAAMTYSVAFNDPFSQSTSLYSAIDSHVGAALATWGSSLSGSANVAVRVDISSTTPRATGASVTSGFVRTTGSYTVFEQGLAYELRTGIDPNGAAADVVLTFNPNYLANELWFDPNPTLRSATVASNRTDAMSVFLHEFGHAIGFNGWGDAITGAPPATYRSTWDDLVSYNGANTFFNGARAVSLYGAPVPITYGNNFHLGNQPGPGSNLIPDLMNGVVFNRGTRYNVSGMDLAILSDIGVGVVAITPVPEPATYAMFAMGLLALGWRVNRQVR